MPISRVQAKSAQVSPAISVSLTLNSATTSGNLLVVCVSCYYAGANAGNAWTASDNKGNTWTSAVLSDITAGKMQVFYAENIAGGSSHQVTLTVAGPSTTYLIMTVLEYSGVATSAALDKANAAFTATNTTAYTSPTTATTAQADEVLIGCHHAYQSAATPTPGASWSTVATQAGSTFHAHTVQDRIVSATGAYASSGTWSATGVNHTDAIVTFKAAAGGGASYDESVTFASTAALSQGAQLAAGASVSMAATAGMSDSGPISAGAAISLPATAAMGPAAQLQAAAGLLLAAGVELAPLTQLAVSAGLGLGAVAAFATESLVAGGGTSYSESLAMAASAQMSQAAALMAAGLAQFPATAAMAQISQVQVAAALNLAAAMQLQALAALDGVDGPMADFLIGAAEYLMAEHAAAYTSPQAAAAYQMADYRTEYLA
jgi:hypothetical protein